MPSQLSVQLMRQFHAEPATDLDLRVELNWHDDWLKFELSGDRCRPLEPDSRVELVIYFADQATMQRIFSGDYAALDAFSAGHLRSNGYLMWVFRVLAAFTHS